MRNKKITMLISSLAHGGAEKVCITLSNEFVKLGHETELWIVKERKSLLMRQLDKRVTVYQLKEEHIKNSLLELLKLFILRKPEKILIFNIELAIYAILLRKLFLIKTKIFVRSINTLSHEYSVEKGTWKKYLKFKIIKYFLPQSDIIIAQSNGMQKDLLKILNLQNNKVITIHNPSINISKNELENYEKKDFINDFLYVGRLSPQKGLVNLIYIFKQVVAENSNVHLTIVGDGYGSQMELLKNVTNNLGLNFFISFEGYQENTLPYFRRAKATLLTSFFEGFPNVLVESIGVGTPVIAFNCPSGPEDIIVPGINGILVPHLNLQEFSKAILAVANGEVKFNPKEVMETSKKFALDKIVTQYEQVFLEN